MNAYRQAALLIANLDRLAADELLDRLPPSQSQAIRDHVLQLNQLEESECEEAIDDFLNRSNDSLEQDVETSDVCEAANTEETNGPSAASTSPVSSPATDFNELNECEHAASPSKDFTDHAGSAPPCATSMEELLRYEDSAIAQVIQHERPSIVAALLRNAPQKKAANLLRQFDAHLQTRVLSHLHNGQQVSSETIEIIADNICDQLAHEFESEDDRIDALLGICSALPEDEQASMLQSLQRDNPVLAGRLAEARSHTSTRSGDSSTV